MPRIAFNSTLTRNGLLSNTGRLRKEISRGSNTAGRSRGSERGDRRVSVERAAVNAPFTALRLLAKRVPDRAYVNILTLLSADNHPSVQSTLYSVVLPSKCSLSASAAARVW